jgi:hypothetical protein
MASKVPPEILNVVYDLFADEDGITLKQLRLVDRYANRIASKKLFLHVFLMALPESYSRLQNIARNPILSSCVESRCHTTSSLGPDAFKLRQRHA